MKPSIPSLAVWLLFAAPAAGVALLALVRIGQILCHLSVADDALFAIVPDIGLVILCAVILIPCALLRPPLQNLPRPLGRPFFALFIVLAAGCCLAFGNIGLYRLRMKIVDSRDRPLAGVTVDFLRQRASMGLISGLLPEDTERVKKTGSDGEATIWTSRCERTSATVNARSGGGRVIDSEYGKTDVDVGSFGRKADVHIIWSGAGGESGNQHTIRHMDPGSTLTVFLTSATGDEASIY